MIRSVLVITLVTLCLAEQAFCEKDADTTCGGGDAVYPADQGSPANFVPICETGQGISLENVFLNMYEADTVNPDGFALSCVAIPCLLYTSPSPRDGLLSRMPSSA